MMALLSAKQRFTGPWGFFAFLLLPALMLAGCAIEPRKPVPDRKLPMRLVSQKHLPHFTDDFGYDALVHAIERSIDYLNRISPDTRFHFGNDLFTQRHLLKSHAKFKAFIETNPSDADINTFIRAHYRVYQAAGSNKDGNVLFTGYYEPILKGSLNATDTYRHPIYARPTDLITIDLSQFSPRFTGQRLMGRCTTDSVVPYFDRAAIDYNDALVGRAVPIAWIEDPIDLFFLHIQGSGKIYLESGQVMNVHYDTANGRPYRSIGKYLIDGGQIPKSRMSMQAIRSYLEAHPAELETVLCQNPSYVFFKTEPDGPLGCLNVKLTPGRSLALDRRIFPLATLSFIETKKPIADGEGNIEDWIDFSRFVLNQDTGGAIRGPGRADLFWGNGPYAQVAAGHMQHSGRLYFLVLKPDPAQITEIEAPTAKAPN
ncbi:MAG: MltA domain-containing protein [Deltaproteobacteria bacterium]|nr:MltA domain-containing protein [Deltaproteobacteria bacterium]